MQPVDQELNESPFIDELDEDPSIEFTSSVIDALGQVHEKMENLQLRLPAIKIKSLFDSMEYKCTPMETLKMMFDGKKDLGVGFFMAFAAKRMVLFGSDRDFQPWANKTGLDANGLEEAIDEYFGDANSIKEKC